MSAGIVAAMIMGLFTLSLTAATMVQSGVAWLTILVIAGYTGVTIIEHNDTGNFNFSDSDDRNYFIIKVCGLGLAFLIFSNLVFEMSL